VGNANRDHRWTIGRKSGAKRFLDLLLCFGQNACAAETLRGGYDVQAGRSGPGTFRVFSKAANSLRMAYSSLHGTMKMTFSIAREILQERLFSGSQVSENGHQSNPAQEVVGRIVNGYLTFGLDAPGHISFALMRERRV
jgi:hypothetical protein